MAVNALKAELELLLAYKESRMRIGTLCVKQNKLPELIELCRPESGVYHQACWCLEQSFLLFEADCYPHLKAICELYPLKINHSGMRSLCKLCFLLSKAYYGKRPHPVKELLSIEMREQLVEGVFDELLTAYGKSANLAFSTNALYLLGTEFGWIHEAMPAIIEQHIMNPDNKGYKSTGGKTLQKLQR